MQTPKSKRHVHSKTSNTSVHSKKAVHSAVGFKARLSAVPRPLDEYKQVQNWLLNLFPSAITSSDALRWPLYIHQGLKKYERLGSNVYLKYFELKGHLKSGLLSENLKPALPDPSVRITIATCNSSDWLMPVVPTALNGLDLSTPLSKDLFPELVEVYYDQVHHLTSDFQFSQLDAPLVVPRCKLIHIKLQFPGEGIHLRYGLGLVDLISQPQFIIKIRSDRPAGPLTPSFVTGWFRYGWLG